MTDEERKRFEIWAKDKGLSLERQGEMPIPAWKGLYVEADTFYAWEGWMARAMLND